MDASAASLLTAEFARRACVLPLGRENGELVVAVPIREAGNIELKDDLTRMTRSRVRFAIANRTEIENKINQVYRAEGELHDLTSDLTINEDDGDDLSKVKEVVDEAPDRQVRQPADHPGDPGPRLGHPHRADRARPAGALPHRRRAARGACARPRRSRPASSRRLKIMADINIAERRMPQDGRMSVNARRPQDRPARGDPADGVGREGRHANPRQLQRPASTCGDLGFCDDNYERLPASRSPSRTG